MPTDPNAIICRACSAGPCRLGHIALTCGNPSKAAGIVTVQDMVNYQAVKLAKTKL